MTNSGWPHQLVDEGGDRLAATAASRSSPGSGWLAHICAIAWTPAGRRSGMVSHKRLHRFVEQMAVSRADRPE